MDLDLDDILGETEKPKQVKPVQQAPQKKIAPPKLKKQDSWEDSGDSWGALP